MQRMEIEKMNNMPRYGTMKRDIYISEIIDGKYFDENEVYTFAKGDTIVVLGEVTVHGVKNFIIYSPSDFESTVVSKRHVELIESPTLEGYFMH